jgi:hypothetical protein
MTPGDLALAYTAERAVAPQVAALAGLSVTDDARTLHGAFFPRAALVIPYRDPLGALTGFGRVRYFDPPEVGGLRKKKIRYQQPKGTAPEIYLPTVAGHSWGAIMDDPGQALAITEGEIKSLSVMANTGLPCMGLGGVFMWADHKTPLPLMEQVQWARRHVFLVFDSDVDSNAGVQLAEARLAQWLLKQRAVVHTCRLPPALDGGKQGADDFIAANGSAPFLEALQFTRSMTDMDLRVLELNTEIAYLDGEEKLIEMTTRNLIRKDSFINGSRYSTLKVPVQEGKGIRMASVAQAWLTHPMARRYAQTLFVPGGEEVITEDGATYLNSWQEQPCRPGDVSLFLDLTRWLFGDTMGDDWDWVIRLLAYKTQHPTHKIPLAIMLIGEQGSGKSLWGALARAAFGKYGASKNGSDLGQDWNGFLENGLLVTIDDVSARQMRMNIETLRNWISEPRIERKEKYLKNREVSNFALLVFTSNYRDAGAFAHDDRRFLVVGAPKREKGSDYYAPLYAWLRSGEAGANLYHYLLNYDLDGWTPPIQAPLTAEKRMAYEESLSPFERLARDMMVSDAHVVETWLRVAEQWALNVLAGGGGDDGPRAQEILSSIQAFPIRPWYTADELCVMFPHMLKDLEMQTRRWSKAAVPGRVSTALRNCGIYFLRNTDDADGFMWKGRKQQFLTVCPRAEYPREMSQAEFDQAMAQMGTFKPVSRFKSI